MANKKNNQKTKFTPEYIIDLTNAVEPYDVYYAVAVAKCNKYFTQNEFDALIDDSESEPIVIVYGSPEKKPNMFKRFWNWITRKK